MLFILVFYQTDIALVGDFKISDRFTTKNRNYLFCDLKVATIRAEQTSAGFLDEEEKEFHSTMCSDPDTSSILDA